MSKKSNDKLLNALKGVSENANFFVNASYQGSETSRERFTTSGRYLCNSVKKESEKKFYTKIELVPCRFDISKSLKELSIPASSTDMRVFAENEKSLYDASQNFKTQIDEVMKMLDNADSDIRGFVWKKISDKFVRCKDLLDGITIDNKKINKNYDEYIDIVNTIINKI